MNNQNRQVPLDGYSPHEALQELAFLQAILLYHQCFIFFYLPCICKRGAKNKKYVPFLKLFKDIDNKHPSIISIDGRCASGKTTLSNLLKQIYDCNVFKMDDFFLQPHQRTKERLESPGENVDHERFEQEVLIQLSKHEDIKLHKFNCSTLSIQSAHLIPYKSFNVIEGSYSMHSDLQKYYSYSVFLTVSKEEQLSRLEKRNPNMLNNFIQRWIPLEELYFKTFSIKDICDIKIDTSKA